jgi:hypothetical protein
MEATLMFMSIHTDDRAGSLQGLLGNGDGDSSNDFALRDGTDLGT